MLADGGHVFVEAGAHRTVYDGCVAARGQGATLHRFHADRPEELRALLASAPARSPRLVCLDGVDSMTGNVPDLPALAAVGRAYGATLYVDDAHGFGVIGERGQGESCPYGMRGNSVVRHTGETYDGIVLAGGFSKAYSSLLAFLALPTALKDRLKTAAAPYLYSGPSRRRPWRRPGRVSTSTTGGARCSAPACTGAPAGCSTISTGWASPR